jgi:RHS repeat-associated protein
MAYDYRGIRAKKVFHGPHGTLTAWYLDACEIREGSTSPGQLAVTEYVRANEHTVASITRGKIQGAPKATDWTAAAGQRFTGSTVNGLPEGTWFTLTNHQASPVITLDGQGREVTRYLYYPYGAVSVSHTTGPDSSTVKFTGHEDDEEASLIFAGARCYDPAVGRFTTADASRRLSMSTTAALNRYGYAAGNPVHFVDPNGAEPLGYYCEGCSSQDWVSVTGSASGVSGQLSMDRFGTLYLTGSMNILNLFGGVGVGVQVGELIPPEVTTIGGAIKYLLEPRAVAPTQQTMTAFMSGPSTEIGASYFFSGSVIKSESTGLDWGSGRG